MKKRTKIILISLVALMVALALSAWHFAWLWHAASYDYRSHLRSSPPGEPVAFGESDEPAVAALNQFVENGLLYVTCLESMWGSVYYVSAMDGRAMLCLQQINDGLAHLAIDMKEFWWKRLSETWWRSGGNSFCEMRNIKMSYLVRREPVTHDLYWVMGDYLAQTDRCFDSPAAFLAALRREDGMPAITYTDGWYELLLTEFKGKLSSQVGSLMRWAADGSAIEFVLDARPFKKGRCLVQYITGWEYDKKANTLIKRIGL